MPLSPRFCRHFGVPFHCLRPCYIPPCYIPPCYIPPCYIPRCIVHIFFSALSYSVILFPLHICKLGLGNVVHWASHIHVFTPLWLSGVCWGGKHMPSPVNKLPEPCQFGLGNIIDCSCIQICWLPCADDTSGLNFGRALVHPTHLTPLGGPLAWPSKDF